MKWISLMLLSILCGFRVLAQVNDQKTFSKGYAHQVDTADYMTLEGPNTAFYQHGFLSYGVNIPMEEADSLQSMVSSSLFEYGTRLKWKASNWFSAGVELSYQFQSHRIQQDSSKNVLGLGQVFESQKLRRHLINAGGFIRFNVGKRGNHLGRYLDLGGFGGWVIGSRLNMKTEDVASTGNYGSQNQSYTVRKLNFTAPLVYGVNVRIGFNKVVFWGRYRISDLFKASDEINNGRRLPNLTPLTVGIQLAF